MNVHNVLSYSKAYLFSFRLERGEHLNATCQEIFFSGYCTRSALFINVKLSFKATRQNKDSSGQIYLLIMLKQMQFALFTCYKLILIVYKPYQIII